MGPLQLTHRCDSVSARQQHSTQSSMRRRNLRRQPDCGFEVALRAGQVAGMEGHRAGPKGCRCLLKFWRTRRLGCRALISQEK
jgi:hypothetical protein